MNEELDTLCDQMLDRMHESDFDAACILADRVEEAVSVPDISRIRSEECVTYNTLQLVNRWSYLCEARGQFRESAEWKWLQLRLHQTLLAKFFPECANGAGVDLEYLPKFAEEAQNILLEFEVLAFLLMDHVGDSAWTLQVMDAAETYARANHLELNADQAALLAELRDDTT